MVAALPGDKQRGAEPDRRPILEPHRDFIVDKINRTSHLTLHRLREALAARGAVVSHNTVWEFLRRAGLRLNKVLLALERGRADVARKRARWRAWQGRFDPRRLVFIDETWIRTNMASRRGCRQTPELSVD